ncbi:hypothetical protein ABIB80_007264 [Bradyrhizobium sp. i1.15.2]|uniref:hypothetical protein n=1 Tax=Bradyrhizobium sp. i1.15.2 TaxID=3156362 RepID=UPI0033956308
MDDRVQPRRASRRWSQYPLAETLNEDLASAQVGVAAGAAGDHQELYDSPRTAADQLRVADTGDGYAAKLSHKADSAGSPNRDDGLITLVACILYNKPTWHQTGAVACLLHGADSPPINAPDILELHLK